MAYWQVPAEVLEDPDELATWAREAMGVALAKRARTAGAQARATPRGRGRAGERDAARSQRSRCAATGSRASGSSLAEQPGADPGHGPAHLERVVATALRLAAEEGARLEVVLPAAWLHDCVHVAKDSPDRARASRLAADHALRFLESAGYPAPLLPDIRHAIEAHSYSAGIAPRTIEAKVVQDADRLDALGADRARALHRGRCRARPPAVRARGSLLPCAAGPTTSARRSTTSTPSS